MNNFFHLDPNSVLKAAELAGFAVTGELNQLNSYENRVFALNLEDGESIIVKFYRPQRWDKNTIYEEHTFLKELADEGIHVIQPLILPHEKHSLMFYENMWVAFFPKMRARLPQELLSEDLKRVGRLMARVHNIGAQKEFVYRPTLDSNYYGGWDTLGFLQNWIAPEVRERYNEAAEWIIHNLDEQVNVDEYQRIHGDCHRGNLLSQKEEFFLIDFDDVCMGPVVQDVWMLLSGDSETLAKEKESFLSGYEELRSFPNHQWDWIPILRGIRVIGYAGWIAKRWNDPSFHKIFPEFNSYRYWAEEADQLDKIARLI